MEQAKGTLDTVDQNVFFPRGSRSTTAERLRFQSDSLTPFVVFLTQRTIYVTVMGDLPPPRHEVPLIPEPEKPRIPRAGLLSPDVY